MEFEGYELEAAEGSFELLVREALRPGLHFFEVDDYAQFLDAHFRALVLRRQFTATVTLQAQDGVHSATADGHGPFNALHLCLRKCLSKLYPQIAEVRLTDYKVRVLDSHQGTAAKVRVLIEWSDHRKSWTTAGVSDNVYRGRAGKRWLTRSGWNDSDLRKKTTRWNVRLKITFGACRPPFLSKVLLVLLGTKDSLV